MGLRCLQAEFQLTAVLHVVFAKPAIIANLISNISYGLLCPVLSLEQYLVSD